MSYTENRAPPTGDGFYVTGGTLGPDAPCYVQRQADSDLHDGLSRGEFCYVLTSRQMGKSSLMARTAARLQTEGCAVAVLELSWLGRNLSPEQWYYGLLSHLGQQLDLREALREFWRANPLLGPLQRWITALREVVLPACPGRVVIFVDEIDTVQSLPFSTDEFFAAIRECYNRRAQDPEFQRLTFCLLGVARPTDLIQDTRTTPFNIGRRIELTDFTEKEAMPLRKGLELGEAGTWGRCEAEAIAILRRILFWTGGHPYLTQRLCQAVAQTDPEIPQSSSPNPRSEIRDPQLVDRLCDQLFFSHGARERDDNLLFVRDRLLRTEVEVASLLDLYARVWSGKRVRDDETNRLVSVLRLSGITRVAADRRPPTPPPPPATPGVAADRRPTTDHHTGSPSAVGRRWSVVGRRSSAQLRVRNRIYARVFDREWIAEHVPDAELRRQRAAYHRGLLRATAISTVILAVMGGLLLFAVNQALRAADRERDARRSRYVAQMNMAQMALNTDHPERVAELLEAQWPAPGAEDMRGWEWRYLWRLSHRDRFTFPRHNNLVSLLQFLPDGKTLATGTASNRIRLWNLETRQEITAFEMRMYRSGCFALSRDGKLFAAASIAPDSPGMPGEGVLWQQSRWEVKLRNRATDTESTFRGRGGKINCLAFSPDGTTLAAGSCEPSRPDIFGEVKLWDLATRRETMLCTRKSTVFDLAFSPDGKTLAVSSANGTVSLWNLPTRQEVAVLRGRPARRRCLAFSPDGNRLAAGSSAGWEQPNVPGEVEVWDLATRRVRVMPPGHKGFILCLAFSPDGRTLATGSLDRTIRLWDLPMEGALGAPEPPGRAPGLLIGHTNAVTSVTFSPDGKTLASGSLDRTVKLWDARADIGPAVIGENRKDPYYSLAFSRDSRTLAMGSGDGTVTLWDTSEMRQVATLKTPGVGRVRFLLDGNMLAGAVRNTVRLRSVATGRETSVLEQQEPITRLAISPDGRTFATGSPDGAVRLWDAATKRRTLLRRYLSHIDSLTFSLDGRTLAAADGAGAVALWDIAANRKPTVAHFPELPSFLALSGDGRIVVALGSNRVRLWDVPAGRQITLSGLQERIRGMALSPDGRSLATGSWYGPVKLWNVATGELIGILEESGMGTREVAFSPDGTILAATCRDGYARLWRAATLQEAESRHGALPRGLSR